MAHSDTLVDVDMAADSDARAQTCARCDDAALSERHVGADRRVRMNQRRPGPVGEPLVDAPARIGGADGDDGLHLGRRAVEPVEPAQVARSEPG